MTNMLTTALEQARNGRPVFVLGPTKRPVANCDACRDVGDDHDREACPCLTCHGFYAATRDPERIRAMFAAVPSGMLAIRAGAASGLVVVDIDPDHGGRVDPDLMPTTTYVRTGSGGWHLYYRHPGQPIPNSAGRLGPGVDVRGDGGYVVAPPSIHPRTRLPYRWVGGHPMVEMPPALVRVCLPPPTPTVPATTRPTTTRAAGGISSPAALLAANLEAVARAPEGRRRTTLYGAARGVARMVAAGALSAGDAWSVLTEAGRSAGQSERETRAAISGGFRAEGVSA